MNFEVKGIGGVGFTGNLSPTGMHIHSKFTSAPGSILRGQISGPEGTKVEFQAQVRWVHRAAGPLAQLVQGSMGMRFVVPPSEAYLRLLSYAAPPSRATSGP